MYESDTRKTVFYIYIGIITFIAVVNIIGNLYIKKKSEKYIDSVKISLEEYRNLDLDSALDQAIKEIDNIKDSSITFLRNWGIEMVVMLVLTLILLIPIVIKKVIEYLSMNDSTYSEYSSLILGISSVIALVSIYLDFKGISDCFSKYIQIAGYHRDILHTLNGLLNSIGNFTF